MDVATVRSDLQRASGEVSVSAKRRDDKSVLDKLRQAGYLKVRFPRDDNAGGLNVVTLIPRAGSLEVMTCAARSPSGPPLRQRSLGSLRSGRIARCLTVLLRLFRQVSW
jgi:hypothetical protein